MGRINIRDRILYVYMYTGYIMAKLYWRYKKNGRWTWAPVELGNRIDADAYLIKPLKEVEE